MLKKPNSMGFIKVPGWSASSASSSPFGGLYGVMCTQYISLHLPKELTWKYISSFRDILKSVSKHLLKYFVHIKVFTRGAFVWISEATAYRFNLLWSNDIPWIVHWGLYFLSFFMVKNHKTLIILIADLRKWLSQAQTGPVRHSKETIKP